uniref:C2H2-type domain-containing protein n=1 Tax=Aegilops tauschii TaxID=37682 RepID=M8CC84_AEGTA
MGVGMKRAREEEPVSLALALTTDSAASSPTSAHSASSGEGEFVCKTCSRAFATFQALGGHRTSHLRGRHGLELGVGVARAIKERKRQEEKQHECHICGLGFEMGQALGGHMRGHREEMALRGGGDDGDQWVWRGVGVLDQEAVGHQAAANYEPPVLLELFV